MHLTRSGAGADLTLAYVVAVVGGHAGAVGTRIAGGVAGEKALGLAAGEHAQLVLAAGAAAEAGSGRAARCRGLDERMAAEHGGLSGRQAPATAAAGPEHHVVLVGAVEGTVGVAFGRVGNRVVE